MLNTSAVYGLNLTHAAYTRILAFPIYEYVGKGNHQYVVAIVLSLLVRAKRAGERREPSSAWA